MCRTAELHPAATRHEDSGQRDDAVHGSIPYSVSLSRGAPWEHRVVAMRLGPAQLVVRTVCVHNHSGIFEQPQTATTTPMSGHELDTHSIDTRAVAGHRMGYYEYVHGAYYGLKYRASQKRYLVTDLRLQLLGPTRDGRPRPTRCDAPINFVSCLHRAAVLLSFLECPPPPLL